MWIRKNNTALEIVGQPCCTVCQVACPQAPLGKVLSWPVLELPETSGEMLHRYVSSAERGRLFLHRFQDALLEAIFVFVQLCGSIATASSVHWIVNNCADNCVCFFLSCVVVFVWCKKNLHGSQRWYRWRTDWESPDAQIRHCISGIFYSFFFSTVKTGGGQQVLSSSVSYFYLQGSKHLHSL